MRVAISSTRTKDVKLGRYELVNSLQELGHDVLFIGQESETTVHPDYFNYNVNFVPVALGRRNTNPINEIKSIIDTKKALQKNEVEALIAYGIRTFPTMVFSAKLSQVKKITCIVNGSGRLFQLKGIKGLLVKLMSYPMLLLAFLLSNKILFQNPDDLQLIKRKGLLWRKNYGLINGSGVNCSLFNFVELESEPVFLMMSRLTGSKGVNEYVKAARKVKEQLPHATFYLVGPMDDEDASIDILELNKAVEQGIVILPGKTEDVKSYIKKCRVFVLPSYYPEGIPRSILEAMAMGRPIITTDSSGCRETVEEGVNGFLIPPKDSYTLSKRMIWMIEHPRHLEKMGEESRRLAIENFDVYKINEKILKSIRLH